jgi:hypothetical protein
MEICEPVMSRAVYEKDFGESQSLNASAPCRNGILEKRGHEGHLARDGFQPISEIPEVAMRSGMVPKVTNRTGFPTTPGKTTLITTKIYYIIK